MIDEATPTSTDRLESIGKLIDGLKTTFADAKKFRIDIRFEWREHDDQDGDDCSALCPTCIIDIER